jgi:hypothetical protein
MKELTKDLFKENFAKKLNLQQFKGNQDVCSPSTGNAQNQCDLARYTSKIYLALMSDIFKIKQAEILQVSSLESFKSKEDRIALIFETYFHKNETEKNSYQKDFPKTTTMIDNNQKILYKTLQSLVLLDNENIFKQSQESKICTLSGNSVSDFTC